jgi:hypothetical protein
MKLDPGMHIGMHLVFFGKSGVTAANAGAALQIGLFAAAASWSWMDFCQQLRLEFKSKNQNRTF